MSGTPYIYETPRSQKFRQDAAAAGLTRSWFIGGTQDPLEARDLLLASNPVYFMGLSRKSVQIDPLGAPDLWAGEVEYGLSAFPDGWRPDQLSFKITAASTHIAQGLVNQYRLSTADVEQSGTYLEVNYSDNTLVQPDGYDPVPGDVGKSVVIEGGGGWTGGTYAIDAIVTARTAAPTTAPTAVYWKLASSPAAVNTEFGVWTRPGTSTVSGTNLSLSAATDTEVTPDGHTPSAADVGNSVVVTGGTGWKPGAYLITAVAGGKWLLTASPSETGADLTGGVWHLSGTGADCQGAIGVTLDSVQGCDILVPKVEWSLSVQRAVVDPAFLRTVRSLVGKTNDATFYGYGPGTLLYLGCEPTSAVSTLDDGSKLTFWNLSHSFAHEEDATDVKIGNITVPKKGGHEYLWARYAPQVKAGTLVQNPTAVYVEQVYKSGNFALLEIGT